VYGICRAYDIDKEELLKANPAANTVIKIGEQLKIPKKTAAPRTKVTQSASLKVLYVYHITKEKETLYAIANHYGITVNDILTANPDLERSLQVGRVLRIPQFENSTAENQEITVPPTPQVKPSGTAPAQIVEENNSSKSSTTRPQNTPPAAESCNPHPENETITIILFLPFNLSEYEVVDLQRSFGFAEFYEGLLMALEKVQQQGANIKLYVWDTKSSDIKQLLTLPMVTQAHLIIGPVYPNEFATVAQFAQKRGIRTVSPLTVVDSDLHNNPYVFQVPASFEAQTHLLLSHPEMNETQSNTILISQAGNGAGEKILHLYKKYFPHISSKVHRNGLYRLDSSQMARLEYEFDRRAYSAAAQQISYQTGLLPRDNHETFLRVFNPNVVNRVVVASEDEPFVAEVLANLKAFTDYYSCQTVVYGNNKWRKFENIEPDNFYQLNLQLATPYFVDYSAEPVIDFIEQYRQHYKTEPSQFAFQGYDIALYFVSAIHQYGRQFEDCLPLLQVELLQSTYRFKAKETYQYRENQGAFLLRYNALPMKIVPYQ
jgi:LysM repeat protein